ncbi:MAG: DUF2058 family protein [Deltaproteobacteria bacterium]|nr:DUF2058 family protein [Deltaproteobacteria bacterium]
MLSLKDKLLKAGVVTAEQVKKVENEEAARQERARAAREARANDRGGRGAKGERRDDDGDERRAAREHAVEEAQRWRQRLEQLTQAGKSEQYQAIRGWVVRHRLDDKATVSDAAVRFHFAKEDGAIGHLTVEPEVQAQLAAGSAGVIAFMGFNGVEHAVVPADLARDIHTIKPEWVRSLVGVTDADPAAAVDAPAVASPGDGPAEG